MKQSNVGWAERPNGIMQSMIPPGSMGLYIHFPWCIRKCPYCDFNSHALKNELPETEYVATLIKDLDQELAQLENVRPLTSIFMGGGTPSLFSPQAIEAVLQAVFARMPIAPQLEITLEANPGTVDVARFAGFFQAGVNRLSMGVQSFQDRQLTLLGRIHNSDDAKRAIDAALQAGFTNFNLDIMHGLPEQTLAQAMADIETALSFSPPHFSWYQLTLETNTYFHRFPPTLPNEEILETIQAAGQARLQVAGLMQYEVSAYSRPQQQCQHNLNYWEFGDYIGIGAGAHGKQTTAQGVQRYWKFRQPKEYLREQPSYRAETRHIPAEELPFEFMLNALRLRKPVTESLLHTQTGLTFTDLARPLTQASNKGLLIQQGSTLIVTELGHRFLNDLVEIFMP